jgi:hypothetical protein
MTVLSVVATDGRKDVGADNLPRGTPHARPTTAASGVLAGLLG